MPLAETARLVSSLELDTSKFTSGIRNATGSLGKLSGSIARSRAVAVGLGVGLEHLAEKGIGALGNAIGDGINNLAQLETATTSVDAAIKSVGLTGKVTADQIAAWGVQIETSVGSAFDDKAITANAATLLRYGKVTQDNLKPALVVMTDLAAKTGSVDSAATLLARALADPAKAAGKLARSGVILTKAQQDQIKALEKAGKTAQAQKVLLDALSQTTKGAAAASQGPYTRSLNELRDTYEEVTKALAVGFLPIIEKVRDILSRELAKPETLARIKAFGSSLASGLGRLVDVLGTIDWGKIADSLGTAAGFAGDLVGAFLRLPTWVQTAVITGWGLNKLTGGALSGVFTSLASGLIKGVLGINAGVVNINAATVNGGGGVGDVVPKASGVLTGLGGLSAAALGQLALLAAVPLIPLVAAYFLAGGAPAILKADKAGRTATATARGLDPSKVPDTGGLIDPTRNKIAEWFAQHLPRATTTPGAATAVDSARQLEPFNVAAKDIAAAAKALRAAVAPKTPKQATAILKTGAAHDKETSSSVKTAIATNILAAAVSRDAENSSRIGVRVAALKDAFISTAKLDASQITDLRKTVTTQVGRAGAILAAASAREADSSAGIASAIRAAAPVVTVNVDVSATSVTKKTTIIRRYGPTGGTRETSARQNEGIPG